MAAASISRRFILVSMPALALGACAQPRAQVDETRPAPRIVDPKTELERRGR
ncbi:MAG: hypothetical protein JNK84_04675 [Phreatobacter sp.]|uniref:hypothetical protein n=1 Tax=Phreatobacter sp. TaxID=1966341 RepID=UPI001A52775F|nr:hypothetical protein [Phreatobacter sp.]MBL8568359.1 hypothetical protein [Phreatobacter sp.]